MDVDLLEYNSLKGGELKIIENLNQAIIEWTEPSNDTNQYFDWLLELDILSSDMSKKEIIKSIGISVNGSSWNTESVTIFSLEMNSKETLIQYIERVKEILGKL